MEDKNNDWDRQLINKIVTNKFINMKTLNDFKKENKDLGKLEMANAQGGLADPKTERRITAADDSNWNAGDIEVCTEVAPGSWICIKEGDLPCED